jgi:hypothetical protein
VQVGVPDESLTRFSGLAAVTELVERLGVIERLDAAVGPIKARGRGFTAGQVLVGMATAQLCGEDFLVGLDRASCRPGGSGVDPGAGVGVHDRGGARAAAGGGAVGGGGNRAR